VGSRMRAGYAIIEKKYKLLSQRQLMAAGCVLRGKDDYDFRGIVTDGHWLPAFCTR